MKRITTDRQVAGLKPAAKPYEVVVESNRGLCIRIFPSGTKQFEFRYTALSGLRRRQVLGAYPDLGLAAARAKAAALRVKVTEGQDPVAAFAIQREQARTGETLAELAEAYWAAAKIGLHGGRRKPKSEVTLRKERTYWSKHLAPTLASRRYGDLKRSEIRVFMRDLAAEARLRPASVASVGSLLQSILGYGVLEERLETNPAIGLAQPLALTSRDRMFSDAGIHTLWKAGSNASAGVPLGRGAADKNARLEPDMGLALRFLILTLARRTEVVGARWAEVDLEAGLWTIPAERSKARHLHVVPLGSEALSILEKARLWHPRSDYVFPSSQTDGHLDPHALTRSVARICRRNGLPPGSPHDIRRSGATTLVAQYGVSRLVVGLVLGHTAREGAAVTGVYDRHTYIPEKRAALEKWAAHVMSLENRF